MKDFLTEKLMFNSLHGSKDCTLEVCRAGDPNADDLIFTGSAADCLRKAMEYELPMTGDHYFSFTTRQDNYCGINFEELSYKIGYNPETLQSMLHQKPSLDAQINSADSSCTTSQRLSRDVCLTLPTAKAGGFLGQRPLPTK